MTTTKDKMLAGALERLAGMVHPDDMGKLDALRRELERERRGGDGMIRLAVQGVARILVTGSRRGASREDIRARLDQVMTEIPPQTLVVIVHGDAAEGADRHAKEWAIDHAEDAVLQEAHPARWKRPDGTTDRGAGFARNSEMVSIGADLCLAFVARCVDCPSPERRPPVHGTHGAVHCATAAAQAGIPVRTFRQES